MVSTPLNQRRVQDMAEGKGLPVVVRDVSGGQLDLSSIM